MAICELEAHKWSSLHWQLETDSGKRGIFRGRPDRPQQGVNERARLQRKAWMSMETECRTGDSEKPPKDKSMDIFSCTNVTPDLWESTVYVARVKLTWSWLTMVMVSLLTTSQIKTVARRWGTFVMPPLIDKSGFRHSGGCRNSTRPSLSVSLWRNSRSSSPPCSTHSTHSTHCTHSTHSTRWASLVPGSHFIVLNLIFLTLHWESLCIFIPCLISVFKCLSGQ